MIAIRSFGSLSRGGVTALLVLSSALACGSSSNSAGKPAMPDGSSGATSSAGASGANPTGGVTLTLTPLLADVSFSGRIQFVAMITGTSNTKATWSIQEGASGGTISDSGAYSAPATAGMFHIIATSQADSTKTATATVSVHAPQGTPPTLQPGVWTNISPPMEPFGQIGENQTLAMGFALDPGNPYTLYECASAFNSTLFTVIPGGLWRTTDGGSNWERVGVFDAPTMVAVDPGDSKHLYVADGVRGNTIGFWVSTDAGVTWTKPDAFTAAGMDPTVETQDTYSMAVDPSNFNHVLLSFHYGWTANGTYTSTAGIFETTDGGTTFTIHQPDSRWGGLGYFVSFLSDPAHNAGDGNTWLLGTQASGYWKTSDAGKTWKQVATQQMPHEGSHVFYASDGTLYSGGFGHPMRSTDNGDTFTVLDQTPNGSYCGVLGDGTTLYIQQNGFTNPDAPYMTSPERDGTTWTTFGDGSQKFTGGPFQGGYDPVNKILYASMYESGLWALKPN